MRIESSKILHRSAAIEVMRGTMGAHPVVFKRARNANDADLRARLKYEHSILLRLAPHAVPHVPRGAALYEQGGELGLVTEDIGATALRQLLPLTASEVVSVAQAVCSALAGVHACGITHKDINPDNVVCNRQTQAVELIDFGIAAYLAHETQALESPSRMEGTVAYVSPEQTGRMNRSLDHRSDLYSLGVTLYELLTGRKPFDQADPADLIYAHLTALPPHVCDLAPELPRALGEIVAKLLQKAPEERYQSALGLRHDLEQVAPQLLPGAARPPLVLASQDVPDRFGVPEKLYGRSAEQAVLIQAYDRTSQGARELVMVSGPSGIGKSSLVQELRTSLSRNHGLYSAGKHEQVRRHIPFSALAQAIEAVVQQILLEPPAVYNVWQRRVREALGRAGQPMLDISPALQPLVGALPAAIALPPQEAEQRLVYLLDRLLRAFCVDQPLVLFLDDLQWADTATLRFLARWRTEGQGSFGLLLIGAYRSDEVAGGHPLTSALDELKERHVLVRTVAVTPMTLEAIEAMLRDATGASRVTELAELLYARTAGNAYFVRAWLQDLAQARLFHFEAERRCWRWDIDAIRGRGVAGTLVGLMTDKIEALNAAEKQSLAVAALMGNEFTLGDLSSATQLTSEAALTALRPALEAGLLLPVGNDWRYALQNGGQATFRFAHDKVREAAAMRLLEAERARVHYTLGRAWLARYGQEKRDNSLFAAVGHLNQALPLLGEAERAQLAEHNRLAAEEAQRACAYDIAAFYWRQALREWDAQEHPQVRMAKLQTAYCELLSGERAAADARLAELLLVTTNPDERADIYGVRSKCLAAMLKHEESVAASLHALAGLGVKLPRNPNLLHVVWGLVRLNMQLRGRPVETLAAAPQIGDPSILRVLGLLNDMTPPAYTFNANLFAVAVLKMGQLTFAHGNSQHSAFIYSVLVAIFAGTGNYVLAARYAQATRAALKLLPPGAYSGGLLGVEVSFGFLGLHARDAIKAYLQSAVRGMAAGDVLNASNSMGTALVCWMSVSTEELLGEMESHAALCANLSREFLIYRRYMQQAVRCLRGQTRSLGDLSDATFDEAAERARLQSDTAAGVSPLSLLSYKVLLGAVHREFEATIADGFAAIKQGVLSRMGEHSAFIFDFYFGVALSQAALVPGATEKPVHMKELRRIHALMRKRAAVEPFLALGACQLVAAEMAALQGKAQAAAPLYTEATQRLDATGYNAFAALAHECAGRFYLRLGGAWAGDGHLRAAAAFFTHMGAHAKLKALQREFGDLANALSAQTKTGTATDTFGEKLDLPALMRATHAMSAEVVVERLTRKIVDTTQLVAGATRAVLLLPNADGVLVPEIDSAPTSQGVSTEVIQYMSRTQDAVVSDDAVTDPRWEKDTYIQHARPRALLCAPLLQQGTLRGAIYLENAVTPKAFTLSRLQLVKTLAAQAAVSLDNARLYRALEEKVAQRTEQIRLMHDDLMRAQHNADETRMAGGFAHEMLNALAGVNMTVESMLENHGSALAATRAPHAQPPDAAGVESLLGDLVQSLPIIRDGLTRALNVTMRILQYAEVGHQLPGSDRLQVLRLVEEVVDEQAPHLAAQQVRYELDIPPDATLVANRDHVTTVLRSLMDNAYDAAKTQPGTDSPWIRVRWEESAASVSLVVDDSGPGMDEATRGHIFEPFFSTKGRAGAGLSLGLSRKLAQIYGGDLQFSSQPGQGSSFRLNLPRLTDGLPPPSDAPG